MDMDQGVKKETTVDYLNQQPLIELNGGKRFK